MPHLAADGALEFLEWECGVQRCHGSYGTVSPVSRSTIS